MTAAQVRPAEDYRNLRADVKSWISCKTIVCGVSMLTDSIYCCVFNFISYMVYIVQFKDVNNVYSLSV